MLGRLKKRIENLMGGNSAATAEPTTETSDPSSTHGFAKARRSRPQWQPDPEVTAKLARREAQRREARLLLKERIHNRSVVLMSELRNHLLSEIHNSLQEHSGPKTLKGILGITLDPNFIRTLDNKIDSLAFKLIERLKSEFRKEEEIDPLSPMSSSLVEELRTYRDQIVRTYLLDQVEVFALPQLGEIFPEGGASPEQLKQGIASYWKSCREAIDRFFHAVEMSLLNGAREGLRIDATVIRERLLAAQYRNGYRALGVRATEEYAQVAQLQMLKGNRLTKMRPEIDRRVVEGIIVPLAFFIRDRAEPESLEALRTRAELFRDLVDKMVTSGDPFSRTAEALKPLLRRSIEQARPLVLEAFSYLAAPIESLKPTEVHRATALLHMFETLLKPDLDEKALQAVEQNVRLNKIQYHIYTHIDRTYPRSLPLLQPLDRVQPSDAEFFLKFLQEFDPPAEAIETMARRLGYLSPDDASSNDPLSLIRAIAALALPRRELTSWAVSLQSSTADPKRARGSRQNSNRAISTDRDWGLRPSAVHRGPSGAGRSPDGPRRDRLPPGPRESTRSLQERSRGAHRVRQGPGSPQGTRLPPAFSPSGRGTTRQTRFGGHRVIALRRGDLVEGVGRDGRHSFLRWSRVRRSSHRADGS